MAAGALDTPVAMKNYTVSDIIPDEVQDRLLEIGYTLEETFEGTYESATKDRLELIENMLNDFRASLEEAFTENENR